MAAKYRKSVLIVDDDERNLITLESLFESRGYDTVTAWGGKEALKLLRSRDFDLVLLDDFLPDIPSEEILKAIRQLPIQPLVALLKGPVLSGSTSVRFTPLAADCSVSKKSLATAVGSIQECLSYDGPLTMPGPRELAVTQA